LASSGQGCTTSTAMTFSPWIAIVSRHVLSWVFPGCLLTAVFSRPYSEWNCRDVSTFKKLKFYPLLKWQTSVWSLQLCLVSLQPAHYMTVFILFWAVSEPLSTRSYRLSVRNWWITNQKWQKS
jgi:hypothetical protein